MVQGVHLVDLGEGAVDGMALCVRPLIKLGEECLLAEAVEVEVAGGHSAGCMEEEHPLDGLSMLVEAVLAVAEADNQQ